MQPGDTAGDTSSTGEERGVPDRELDDALRDMQDAGTDEDNRRRWTAAAEVGKEGDRQAMERLAYTEGFNPVADSNVRMEKEDARRRAEAADEERMNRQREEKAMVENRVYAIGTAAVKFPATNCMAVRCARNALRKAVEAAVAENEAEEKRIREAGEKKLRWKVTSDEIERREEQRLAETVEMVVGWV